MKNDINKEEVSRWLYLAENDYDFSVFVRNSDYKPDPNDKICFHCQQAAEKAVKALIIHLGKRGGMPKKHDISFLLDQVSGILKDEYGIDIPAEIKDAAGYFNDLITEARYPIERDITSEEAVRSLGYAESILGWVKNIINE